MARINAHACAHRENQVDTGTGTGIRGEIGCTDAQHTQTDTYANASAHTYAIM